MHWSICHDQISQKGYVLGGCFLHDWRYKNIPILALAVCWFPTGWFVLSREADSGHPGHTCWRLWHHQNHHASLIFPRPEMAEHFSDLGNGWREEEQCGNKANMFTFPMHHHFTIYFNYQDFFLIVFNSVVFSIKTVQYFIFKVHSIFVFIKISLIHLTQTGCWPLPGHPYDNIVAPLPSVLLFVFCFLEVTLVFLKKKSQYDFTIGFWIKKINSVTMYYSYMLCSSWLVHYEFWSLYNCQE